MNRIGYLEAVLDAVVGLERAPEPDGADPWQLAVAAFAATERLDHELGTRLSIRALARLDADAEPATRVTAYAARAFAAAAELLTGEWSDLAPGLTPSGDPIADALPLLDGLGEDDDAEFARFLLAEAALSCARVGLASGLRLPDPRRVLVCDGRAHDVAAVYAVLAARIAAFHGRVAEAQALLDGVTSEAPLLALLVDATRSLVLGNAADPVRARDLAARVTRESPDPSTRVSSGCYLLASFGLVAIGDVRGAASLVLAAGGGADLERLMVTDRAIGLELLTNAALAEGDFDAAEAWAARVESLAASPIAGATVLRTRSRILLARGDAARALDAADRAGERARAEGRIIEASEAEILAARAAIAAAGGGEAGRRLQAMAQEADRTGHLAAVRAARQELRAAGRRLRPLAGTEWSGLSEREREVAGLLLDGHTNAEIAAALFLSPHTVRAHVSRVLSAFGAPSRFTLAARLPAFDVEPLPELTARQRAVVAELATGAGNAEIAARLGISVKTVEKHLHEAMRRLGVTTRVGVLRRASERSAAE
ncbi:helix-turn-helix domain-containing protein [Protaetiibacter larvae]|uniref:Helix-turn-helix transcriptional regulator n=1 Tax=Protaetiibacter larvae TaxID=2592654 RepID=A0A5C1YAH1_9MICO|nr:helix-turn-helix transcriptional regulator [Protaetiibacter larvae]QEO10600.1 helix-turn-helix transcriptional regulator [Protaetiibacter larvae]